MAAQDIEQAVRALFSAFVAGDRQVVEDLLAADFQFTSPYDDAIGRDAYFERCWPNHEGMESVEVERVFVQGNEAFATYSVTTKEGKTFRNTEFFRFNGAELASVNVYFGPSYREGKFVPQS